MGILEGRGETDEALRIHVEERLPIARSMNDASAIAHALFSCARIRIQRGGLQDGEAQTIHDELTESFAINVKLQRADGIGMVGALLGQVLAGGGYFAEALGVLDQSAAAFDKLQNPDMAEQVRALQQTIRDHQAKSEPNEDQR